MSEVSVKPASESSMNIEFRGNKKAQCWHLVLSLGKSARPSKQTVLLNWGDTQYLPCCWLELPINFKKLMSFLLFPTGL